MANCKTCGKAIPDGTEYCNECNALNKADESYLDSLLSSVSQNSTRPARKNTAPVRSTAAPVMPKFLASKAVKAETEKLEKEIVRELEKQPETAPESGEPAKYDILNDSDDSYLDNLFSDTPDSSVPDLELDDKDTVGRIISDYFPEESETRAAASDIPEADIPESPEIPETDIAQDTEIPEADIPESPEIPEADIVEETDNNAAGIADETDNPEAAAESDFLDDLLKSVGADTAESEEGQDEQPETGIVSEEPAEDPIAALTEAFALAEESEEAKGDDLFFSAPEGVTDDVPDVPDNTEAPAESPEVSASGNDSGSEEGSLDELALAGITDAELPDISDLLGDDSEEDEIPSKVSIVEDEAPKGDDTDILEFWSQLNTDGGPAPESDEPSADQKSEEDDSSDEQDELAAMLAGLPGMEDAMLEEPTVDAPTVEEAQEQINKKKPKKGFFARIFGNVREELTEEQLEEKKKAALEQFERDEENAVEAKQRKAEKKAEDAEAAKAKKAEQAEAKKKAAEEKKLKAQKKKEEKDKKEAARRALIEEIEENEGKINKVGASIVFIVFLGVLCFILIGTTVYTYKVSIKQAKSDFSRAQDEETKDRPTWYDAAYQDVFGLDIKEEDQRLYDQIMTVSYINTQLLSYIRYSTLDMGNEALDSLFKGLRRYEKYLSVANELGVSEDLKYLRSEILKELDSCYGIDEAKAYEILDIPTQESYSQAVIDIINELEQLN